MLQASVRNHDQTGRWELPPRMATRTNCVVMDKVPGIELTRHSTCSPSHGSAGKIDVRPMAPLLDLMVRRKGRARSGKTGSMDNAAQIC